jgi:hypothetical protein
MWTLVNPVGLVVVGEGSSMSWRSLDAMGVRAWGTVSSKVGIELCKTSFLSLTPFHSGGTAPLSPHIISEATP